MNPSILLLRWTRLAGMITLIIHHYPKLKCRVENMLIGFIDFNLEMGAGNQKAGANLTSNELLWKYWVRISGKIHSCDLSWKNVKLNEAGAIKAFWAECECFIMLFRWWLWVIRVLNSVLGISLVFLYFPWCYLHIDWLSF